MDRPLTDGVKVKVKVKGKGQGHKRPGLAPWAVSGGLAQFFSFGRRAECRVVPLGRKGLARSVPV